MKGPPGVPRGDADGEPVGRPASHARALPRRRDGDPAELDVEVHGDARAVLGAALHAGAALDVRVHDGRLRAGQGLEVALRHLERRARRRRERRRGGPAQQGREQGGRADDTPRH